MRFSSVSTLLARRDVVLVRYAHNIQVSLILWNYTVLYLIPLCKIVEKLWKYPANFELISGILPTTGGGASHAPERIERCEYVANTRSVERRRRPSWYSIAVRLGLMNLTARLALAVSRRI